MNLYQQLGNIASEISRAINWEGQGDVAQRDRSLARGLELLALTLDDPRYVGRKKEMARLYELLADIFSGQRLMKFDLKQALDYLMPMAMIARK